MDVIAALWQRPFVYAFLRFAMVGVCGTAAHYSVMGALVEFAHSPVLVASTIGFFVGALVNYALNRRFTFTSDATHIEAMPKFFTVCGLGAIMNWLVVGQLLNFFPMHYLVAQCIATGVVLIWNFAINYLWTFRS
jgi:putative flippase GtrA